MSRMVWIARPWWALTVALACLAAPLAAQSAEDLESRLEAAQPEFGAAEALTVRFTLTNTSDTALNVLKWHTPLEGLNADMFDVTRDGEPVPYQGRVIKRAAPGPDDYVMLAPGESVSSDVDLAQGYGIYEEGDYSVAYDSKVFDVAGAGPGPMAPKDSFLAEPLKSNAVSFKLTESRERPAPPPAPAMAPPTEAAGGEDAEAKRPPVFEGCSSSQQSQINAAHSEAETMSTACVLVLAGTPTDKRSACVRYTTWFGTYNATRWNKVKSNFEKIQEAISSKTLTFNCECNESHFAHVFPNNPYRIYLCNAFWSAPLTGTDSKAGTIIHEVSHFTIVADTDDNAYGHAACKNLANNNPASAIQNADSHEYFAENTPVLKCGVEHVAAALLLLAGLLAADRRMRRRRGGGTLAG